MGTPHYIAPEALILGVSVDHRADIYSVGVMLYQMLTGKVPQGVFEMPSLRVPGLDPRLDGIIAHAMREDRDQRYQSATELRSDLENILTQPIPQTVPLKLGVNSQPLNQSRSRRQAASPQRNMASPHENDLAVPDSGPYDDHPSSEAILETTSSLNTTMLVLGSIALLTIAALAFFLANRKTGDVITTVSNFSNSETHNTYFTQLIAAGVTTAKDLEVVSDIRPYGTGFVAITREAFSWSQVQELARRTGAEILTVENDNAGSKQQLLAWLSTSYSSHLSSTVWVREHGEVKILKGSEITSVTDLDHSRKAILQWDAAKTIHDSSLKGESSIQTPPSAPTTPEVPPTPTPITSPAPVSPSATPNTPPVNQPASSGPIEWVNKDGKVIQAEFVRLSGESVVIRKDGSEFTVPFSSLSPASINQAKKLDRQNR